MSGGNESTNSRPVLILLSGLPGTGKTTLAAALARVLPVVVVESDAIRRGLAAEPTYTRKESARVFQIAEERARAALAAGRVAVVDATNVHSDDRRRFLRLARRFDAPIVAVRVVAPDETVRERLSRPREGYSQATMAIHEQMRTRARPFTIPVIVVDTRFDLAPSVEVIRRLVGMAP